MNTRVRKYRARDGHVEEDGSRTYVMDGPPEKNALEHARTAGVGDWMRRHGPWKHYWDGAWHVSEGLTAQGRYVVSRTRFESLDGTPFVPQQTIFDALEAL